MEPEELLFRRAVVCTSALVYWAGVWVQARRVRRLIGRSPNLKPRTGKEKLLWAGWMMVVVIWVGQPFLVGEEPGWPGLRLTPVLVNPVICVLGSGWVAAGYAGTLWCYAAMGAAWRIGINRKEKTSLISGGPYRWVRHPIYAFQFMMLSGALLLLPTGLSLLVMVVHFACVSVKSSEEETYLLSVHGESCQAYFAQTGRFFPRLLPRPAPRGGDKESPRNS